MSRRAVLYGRLISATAFTLLLYSTASAAVIYVTTTGNDQKDGARWATAKRTIQAGINTAASGDEVWVAAGTYAERITHKSGVRLYGGFKGDEKTRDQRNFLTYISKIDGQKVGAVVTVRTGAALSTLIDGFTITNGIGASQGEVRYGGGVYALDACVTVENCVIASNNAGQGGGLYSNGEIVLKNNLFKENGSSTCVYGGGALLLFGPVAVHGNTFTSNRGTYGGALALAYGTGEVSGNTFQTNNSQVGGGIYNVGFRHPAIRQNTFKSNTGYFGAGVGCNGSNGDVTGNVFTSNSALLSGGALYLYNGATGTVSNNVITGCAGQCGFGGAIASNRANPTIVNNTMAGNTAAYGGGGVAFLEEGGGVLSSNIIAFCSSGVYGDYGTRPVLRTNSLYQNAGGNFFGVTPGSGNVLADPAFANRAAGDYHLQAISPCIDAATNADAPAVDFDGALRPLDGDGSGDATADIGAFEAPGAVVTPDMKIGEVKSSTPDGALVGFKNVVVSASFAGLGFIYVQPADRSGGIRVDTTAEFSEGQAVNVMGYLRTVPETGERAVVPVAGSPAVVDGLSSSIVAEPILMSHENLGGAAFGLQQGVTHSISLNNVGLLVNVWGRVTWVDTSGTSFTIWNGAVYTNAEVAVTDPDGNLGVRVKVAEGSSVPAVGYYVRLQGISSTVKNGTTSYPCVLMLGRYALLSL